MMSNDDISYKWRKWFYHYYPKIHIKLGYVYIFNIVVMDFRNWGNLVASERGKVVGL